MADPSGLDEFSTLDEFLHVSHNRQYMTLTPCHHPQSPLFPFQHRFPSTRNPKSPLIYGFSLLSPRMVENKGSSKRPNGKVGLVVGRVGIE